ncbi:MAG TPA: adenylate kinase, partial [Spirochaetota bacterium]|nr:adenylate kinase [Spirochaetota bacterium]
MVYKNLLIFGPPGAGKGTQAQNIIQMQNITHISTGDIFRENIKNETELGKKVKEYSSRGELVPDAITNQMVANRLQQDDIKNGFLLDGYPRNQAQCRALDEILKKNGLSLDGIIVLEVPFAEVKNRLAARAQKEGRVDDADPEVIQNRIDTYTSQSKPCIDYYRTSGKLIPVDGTGSIAEV